jgi:hypothetical protein
MTRLARSKKMTWGELTAVPELHTSLVTCQNRDSPTDSAGGSQEHGRWNQESAQAFLGQAGDWKEGGKGWIKRRPKPDKARGFFYALTPEGRGLLGSIE